MSNGLRLSLAVGLALAGIYLVLRQTRSRDLVGTDLLEAVGLAGLPMFVPGALTMIVEAFGQANLPIFNTPEDRLALAIGGAMLLAASVQNGIVAFRRAWIGSR